LCEKLGSIQGLIVQAVDRCLNVSVADNVAPLLLELLVLEYPLCAVKTAIHRVCRSHPYLKPDLIHAFKRVSAQTNL
jgi:hypothetical protein